MRLLRNEIKCEYDERAQRVVRLDGMVSQYIIAFYCFFFFAEVPDEEFVTTCLLMVFVAVSIPKLARMDSTVSDERLRGPL